MGGRNNAIQPTTAEGLEPLMSVTVMDTSSFYMKNKDNKFYQQLKTADPLFVAMWFGQTPRFVVADVVKVTIATIFVTSRNKAQFRFDRGTGYAKGIVTTLYEYSEENKAEYFAQERDSYLRNVEWTEVSAEKRNIIYNLIKEELACT